MILETQIKAIINNIQPFLQQEGGNIEFDHLEGNVLYIKISGACLDCAMFETDISEGIGLIIKEQIPEIVDVRVL